MSAPVRKSNIKYGMVIDLDKCTGCGTCSVACMTENNVYVLKDETDKVKSITWIRIYRIENGAPFPRTEVAYVPRPCMHCEGNEKHPTAPCVSVCPPTATTQDEIGGIVSQIPTRCIGCRYCMAACPYHARYFNWFDPWPTYKLPDKALPGGPKQVHFSLSPAGGASGPEAKQLINALNPEVAPRMRGVVEKCTFCHHRLMAAKEETYAKALIDEDDDYKEYLKNHAVPEELYQTACTQACPSWALTFGDLNNPEHKINQLLQARKKDAFRLLERLNTNPKVYYLTTRQWVRQKADNYLEVPKGTGY
ncbi:MAG: 4Fe-4S dicluster domain-containing protein [Pseudomonadota bacterium]